MKTRLLFLMLCFPCILVAQDAPASVTGHVRNVQGESLGWVNVMVKDEAKSKILAYTRTDDRVNTPSIFHLVATASM